MPETITFKFANDPDKSTVKLNSEEYVIWELKDKWGSFEKTLALLAKLLTEEKVPRLWIRNVLGMKHPADISHRIADIRDILGIQNFTSGFFNVKSSGGYLRWERSKNFNLVLEGEQLYLDMFNSSLKTSNSPVQRIAKTLVNINEKSFYEKWLPTAVIKENEMHASNILEEIRSLSGRKQLTAYALIGNAGAGKTGYCFYMADNYSKTIYIPSWKLEYETADLFSFIGDKYFTQKKEAPSPQKEADGYKGYIVKKILSDDIASETHGTYMVVVDGLDEISERCREKVIDELDELLSIFSRETNSRRLAVVLCSRLSISSKSFVTTKTKIIEIRLQTIHEFPRELRELLPEELHIPLFLALAHELPKKEVSGLRTLHGALYAYFDHLTAQAAVHNVTKTWYTVYLPFLASKTIQSSHDFSVDEIIDIKNELLRYWPVVLLHGGGADETFGRHDSSEIPKELENTGIVNATSGKFAFSHIEIQRFLAARWRAMVWESGQSPKELVEHVDDCIRRITSDIRDITYSTYLFIEIARKLNYDTKNNTLSMGVQNIDISNIEGLALLRLAGAVGIAASTINEAYEIYTASKPLISWYIRSKKTLHGVISTEVSKQDLQIISGISAILYQTHPVKLDSGDGYLNKSYHLSEIRSIYEELISLFDKNTWAHIAINYDDPDLLPRLINNLGACMLQQVKDIPNERKKAENTAYSILSSSSDKNPRYEAKQIRESLKKALKTANRDPDLISLRRSWIAIATDWFWIGKLGIDTKEDPYKKAIQFYNDALNDEKKAPAFEAEDFVIYLRMAGCEWLSSSNTDTKNRAVIDYIYKGSRSLAKYCFNGPIKNNNVNEKNIYAYQRHIDQYWNDINDSEKYRPIFESCCTEDSKKVKDTINLIVQIYNIAHPRNKIHSFI